MKRRADTMPSRGTVLRGATTGCHETGAGYETGEELDTKHRHSTDDHSILREGGIIIITTGSKDALAVRYSHYASTFTVSSFIRIQ